MRALPHIYHHLVQQMGGVDPALNQWLRQSLAQGGDPNEMIEVLVLNGRTLDQSSFLVALAEKGVFLSTTVDERQVVRTPSGTPEVPYALEHWADGGDRKVRKLMSMGSLEAVLYESFLTEEECEHIKARAATTMNRSAVVGKNFTNVQDRARTSSGTFFDVGADATVSAIEARIATITGIPVNHGEGLQILHYADAQEYQPHFDFFEPKTPEEHKILEGPGNRVGTLILYLNDVEEGGATYFPQMKLAIHPKKGSAIWFAYKSPDGVFDQRSEHAGLPVVSGVKWIATKWLRERPIHQPPAMVWKKPAANEAIGALP